MRQGARDIRRQLGAVACLTVILAVRTAVVAQCTGDCDVSGAVTIDELVRGVNIALGTAPVTDCGSLDASGNGTVTIDDLVRAVNNTLAGCPTVPISGAIVFNAENNRMHAYQAGPTIVRQTVVPSNGDAPMVGRDVNGEICFHRDDQGLHFIAGEDTNQGSAHVTAGWGYFTLTGTQVGQFGYQEIGKLIPTYQPTADEAENYGCGFLSDGRLVTTDVGNQATGTPNGQLIIWFPPFDTGAEYTSTGVVPTTPAHYCKLDVSIGTAQQVAIDAQDRIYVGSARGDDANPPGVYRYTGPFPTSDTADGGCGGMDNLGSPMATQITKERFIPSDAHIPTPSGVVLKPDGGFYVSSVLNGTIAEYDGNGTFVRTVMTEPSVMFPALYGTPLGIGLASDGTIYYADIGLRSGAGVGPGNKTGAVRRVRFVDGEPQIPEILDDNGLDFPDGIGILEAAAPTPTPTPAATPALYVYWDQNEEEDAITPDGQLAQLVTPWDPNGQMAIFPDESGRFVIPYDPTLPSQHNPGSFRPVKYPPIGLAVYDRLGNFTGQTIFVPGPFAGGDIPPTAAGIYNDNGTFEGAIFNAQGDLFATDIGSGQGTMAVPDQGRIVEWFPPDYTRYCIIFGPTQGGVGPHHVDGSGGLKDPGIPAIDPAGNLYIPETGATRVLRFDHSVLPTSADQCGPDQLLSPSAPYTVFITSAGAAAAIARDPTCSTDTSNCWAVTNVISGAFGGNAVAWFDDSGQPTTVKGPIPRTGKVSPLGIAVAPNGDVYFIDIALSCNGADCGTIDNAGAIYKVTFTDGKPSTPVRLAGGMDFPTSVTLCDGSQHVCPMPQQLLLPTPTPCTACAPTPTPPCGVTDSPCTSNEDCCSGQCVFQGACQ